MVSIGVAICLSNIDIKVYDVLIMMIFGKLFGAIFGFFLGCPIGLGLFGLVLGGWYGHRLDSSISKMTWVRSGFQFNTRNLIKDRFNKSIFSIIGFIAKADGKVDSKEIQLAKKIMMRLGLKTPSEQQKAIRAFNLGKSLQFNLDQQLQLIIMLSLNNKQLVDQFMRIITEAACIDGNIHPQKQIILDHIRSKLYGFGYQRHQTNSPFTSFNSVNEDFKLLGVEPKSSEKEIKTAYKRLMGKYHPDRLEAKGANEAQIKEATAKTQKIKAAYERIMQTQQTT